MKSNKNGPPGLFLKTSAIAFFVMALAWLPQANAAVTAGGTIENIATVTWQDSTAVFNPAYTDDAYTQVTVNLVTSAVTLGGIPTDLATGDTGALPAVQTVLSGTTASYLYAITATSNGDDVYSFAGTGIDAVTFVDGTETVGWNMMLADGITPDGGANPANTTLGSAIIVNVVNDTTLEFPGGTLTAFSATSIIVINGIDYRIASVTNGTAPDHGTPVTETLAQMVLEANDDRDDGTGSPGAGTAPEFVTNSTAAAGDIVGEQRLLRVTVTATVSPATATGTVNHDVVLTNTGAQVTQRQDVTTTFSPLPTVTITKLVRNVTAGGGFAATGTGDPGDILEYQLTITNSGSTAEAVVVTDPVPTYTSLVTFDSAGSYGGAAGAAAAGDFFAQAGDGVGTIDLTMQNSDDESATIASGDSTGDTAGSTLTFYVGDNSVNASTATTGGDIINADSFTVIYRMQILP